MKRRTYLKTILGAGAVAAAQPAAAAHPIQLHLDMSIDPAREKEMLHHFETVFRPAAAKQPGYIDVRVMKLRTTLSGKAPAGLNYRFVIAYQSEELRQKWVATDVHQRVWPPMESFMTTRNYTTLLFDVI